MKKKSLLLILLMALLAPWAVAQQSLPYSYGFEDNDLSTDGWTNTDGGISNYYDEGIHSGSYYFYFSYDISEDVYLVSPSLTGGTSGVIVSFWYKALDGSYLDHFKVGYTTDATNTDPSSYTYGSLTTASTDWQQYEVTFPAGTARVAILYDEDNYDDGDYLALDDFSFTAASSCTTPTDLTVNYTAGNTTATATWNSDASSFNVDVNGTVTAVNKKTYTFNVEPATSYTVKVQANCGGEVSGWASTSFFSGCAGISLPYSYGFEDAAAIDCWTVNATGNYPTYTGVSTNYPRTGTKSFRFYYTTNPPQYLISPEFSGYSNGLHVEFWYRQYSSGVETFQVGYSSTTTDDSAFTWGEEITASTTYQRFSANYPATTKYVAVKHTSDDQYYLYLDDFLFEESASCLEPTNVVASNVTTTGATLNWTAGGEETMWDIYVTDDATVVPNDGTTPTVSNTSTKPYPLTVLTPATTYYAYVRAKCGAKEASAWSSPAIFNTDCVEKDLPYSYGFEDNEFDICWSIINTNTSYCGIDIMDPTGSSGNHVLAFYRGSSTGNLVAVSPEISTSYPLNGYQITFAACFANGSGGSMTAGKLGIGIMTDPTDFTTFELIEEVDITDGYSTFGTHTVMFNSYTGSGQYIAIQDIPTQNGYVLVDNIAVTELPACMPATSLGATPSSTSAQLNWTANNGETAWTVYYKKSSDTDYTEVKNVTENPYTLTPLDASTNYDYYVVANCSSTETSDPSEVYSFKTLCGSENTFPWTEDFEKLTVNNSIPDCWDNEDGTATGTYRWFFNTTTSGNGATNGTGHNNSKCVRFNSYSPSSGVYNCLKTVPLSLPASPAMQLSFWYKNPTGGDLSVYLSTDGGATYTKELATGLIGASSWTEQDPINLGAYAGQDVVIVFKATSNCGYGDAYIYLDDVTVNEAPSCAAPNALGAVPSTTSAQLSWTANSGETAWTIYYKKTSESAYTDKAVTTNPYNLTGLASSTDYEYYVVANCSSTETSDPSAVYYFSTECEPFTVTATNKYTQNFESPVVTSTYSSTTDLKLPNCWENPYTTGTSAAGKPHLIAKGSGYNYSSNQVLNFYGSGSNYVTLPEFTNNLQDLQISFKWATESNSNGTLTLGYITDGDVDYNTFTAITGASYPASSSSYHTLIQADPVDLSALPATAKRLAFRWVYSGQYSCNVDDLVVELIPSCKIPTGLTCTDYTATTATFDWTATGTNQTAWQLYISDKNIAPANDIAASEVINVTTKPYTVSTGLVAETTYYAWVRGNCTASSDGYSEWSEGIEFMPSQYKDFTYQETATSSTGYVPFYSYYCSNATNKGQILIPASAFPADMADATVRRLTFYTTSSYASVNWGTAEFDVLVTEVDATSFATATFFDWNAMTTVYSGSLSVSGNQMVIDLDTPFSYTGGNLVIGFNLTTTGTNASVQWVATFGSTYLGAYQYGTNTVNRSMYQPKTTFNYLPNPTPRPINPHATEELSTEATVAWTVPNSTEVTGYQYQYKLATATEWPTTLTDEPGLSATITGLTPEKTYDFRVRAVYPGPAYSQYAETQFTTTAACAIPDGLAAANITMNTADLTWNTSVEVANYTVEYRTAAGNNGNMLNEDFTGLTSGIPANWDNSEGTTTSASYKWSYYNNGHDAAPCLRFNSYSNSNNNTNFLKTPSMDFPAGKTMQLTFWWKNPTGGGFSVYISTDGGTTKTALKEGLTGQTSWKEETIDLTGYEGASNVTIHFKGTSNYGSGDAYIYLDEVIIGEVNTAGAWTAATNTAPNTGVYTIAGLTAGTKYDIRVYANCTTNPDGESTTTTITTLADGTLVFNNASGDGMWSTAANWAPAGAPSITENAVIRANVTIPSGCVANAKNITFEGSPTPTLTIADGGQLNHSNAITATMQKIINGTDHWGQHQGTSNDWYLLSSPVGTISAYNMDTYAENLTAAAISGVPQFDLYKYNEATIKWNNYNNSSFAMTQGLGFLYARHEGTTINFNGSLPVADVIPTLTYTAANGDMAGFNLLGNPFSHSISWDNLETTNINDAGYYRMENGAWIVDGEGHGQAGKDPIKPMEGFLVKATAASPAVTIHNMPSSKGRANNDFISFTASNANYHDVTYAMFREGEGLEKINHRNSNVPMVYIPQDGERYAIATMGDETDMFNLNFKAMTTGKYTLSYKAEGSYDYLHVIDRITGEDVDMLIDGEYSFMASAGDNENRFIVKLRYNANGNFENDIFAYQNGDEIIVNGEGELQIFDVMGRFVTSMQVNGSERISAEQYSNAVYIFRLVGSDVKTQKIVVR